MHRILVVLSLLSMIYWSCTSDDPVTVDTGNTGDIEWNSIEAITGINAFDISGAPIGRKYTSNDHMSEGIFFPNPATDVIGYSSNDDQNIRQIWIISGSCVRDSTTNIRQLAPTLSYNTSDIANKSVQSLNLENPASDFNINLNMLEEGIYKIFIETEDGTLNWQSILIEKSSSQDLDDLFGKYDEICEG